MSRHSEDGATYRRMRKDFLLDNPVCWICGHGQSDQVDHAIPRSVRRTKLDVDNWRPAHGVNGCPTCKRRCNQERGTKAHVPVFVPRRRW